jgi:hypothetical protein
MLDQVTHYNYVHSSELALKLHRSKGPLEDRDAQALSNEDTRLARDVISENRRSAMQRTD